MSDWDYVDFRQNHELNYHLKLVDKSQSEDNRAFLREKTPWTAKKKLGKIVLTHYEFKPFVVSDKVYLVDPA